MKHHIDIPSNRSYGSTLPPGSAYPLGRYLSAYEAAWWGCARDFYENIDHVMVPSDAYGNGWPSAIEGVKDGYHSANAHFLELIEVYGKAEVHSLLRGVFEGDYANG